MIDPLSPVAILIFISIALVAGWYDTTRKSRKGLVVLVATYIVLVISIIRVYWQ